MRQRRSLKDVLVVGATLALVYVGADLGSLAIYGLAERTWFSFSEMSQRRQSYTSERQDDTPEFPRLTDDVIHPYLGSVYDPDVWKTKTSHSGIPVSEWGFIDDKTPLQAPSPDRVVVGVFGGSVAWGLSRFGSDQIIEGLATRDEFKGKEFVIVRTALGAWKQPQQLMALAYLLSLGAHFDVVVNVDGFNELALPAHDNAVHGVYPFYPANWYLRSTGPGKDQRGLVGKISYLRARQLRLARLMSSVPFRSSVTSNVTWFYYDQYLSNTINQLTVQLSTLTQVGQVERYVTTGPPFDARPEHLLGEMVAMWVRASTLIHQICEAKGILYVHALQPNQYDVGSKPLSDAEQRVAYSTDLPARETLERGYPLLRQAGQELVERGVGFVDLSMVFSRVSKPIYIDDCCHVNVEGYEMMGNAIGRFVSRLDRGVGPPARVASR